MYQQEVSLRSEKQTELPAFSTVHAYIFTVHAACSLHPVLFSFPPVSFPGRRIQYKRRKLFQGMH